MLEEDEGKLVECVKLLLSWYNNIDAPKGRQDVDFPHDDYFMALAVLAKSRSPYSKLVYMNDDIYSKSGLRK